MANITTPTIETNVHEEDLYDAEDTPRTPTSDGPTYDELRQEVDELKSICHSLTTKLTTAYDFIEDYIKTR